MFVFLPGVALARLMNLRLSRDDGFMLDVFGLTLVKDISILHNTTKPVRLHGKEVDDIYETCDGRYRNRSTKNASSVDFESSRDSPIDISGDETMERKGRICGDVNTH